MKIITLTLMLCPVIWWHYAQKCVIVQNDVIYILTLTEAECSCKESDGGK